MNELPECEKCGCMMLLLYNWEEAGTSAYFKCPRCGEVKVRNNA